MGHRKGAVISLRASGFLLSRFVLKSIASYRVLRRTIATVEMGPQ